MRLTRHPDWRTRLNVYLAEVRQRPFAFGSHDCALFVAGAVRAMTGRDLARGWRGYRSEEEGLAKLRAAGHADQVALAASMLAEVPPLLAQPGDVVALKGGALGLCQGRMAYVTGEGGLRLVDMADVARAFRVGDE